MKKIRYIAFVALLGMLASPAVIKADELQIPQADEKATAETAAEAPVTYTIVPHDTLWDISKRFLKNPFKWPKIWKQNPYIENPDLIYPGNVVKIFPNGEIQILSKKEAEVEKLPVVSLEETEKVVVLEPSAPEAQAPAVKEEMPAQRITSTSLSRKGFVTRKELDASGAIVKPLEEKILINEGDVVFISFKDKSAVNEGERYTVYSIGDEITHPVTKKNLGNLIDVLGSVVITKKNDSVEGRIDKSYKEIIPGSRLGVYKEPVKEVVVTNASSDVNGFVVASLEAKENLSRGDIIYIDKGTRDGLDKGNVLTVYRDVKSEPDPLRKRKNIKIPPIILGTAVVVEANESTSACILVKSLRAINWGDKVSTAKSE